MGIKDFYCTKLETLMEIDEVSDVYNTQYEINNMNKSVLINKINSRSLIVSRNPTAL